MRELLKRELFLFAQYFMIACIAAAVGHYALENAQEASPLLGSREGAQVAVNVKEMVAALWRDYFRWVFGVFAGLSAFRLLIVLLLHRANRGVA